MDITTKTETELKAIAYDQIVELDRIQKNINLINQELAKRSEKPTTEAKE